MPIRWRHNGHDSVSNHQPHRWNHQPHHCLLNRLFRRRSKKISELRVTGLCVGNSPGTGEFPAQMASNAENVSISWRHHAHLLFKWNAVNSTLIFIPISAWSAREIGNFHTTSLYRMTSSNGNISALLDLCAGIHRSPVDSLHNGQWRGRSFDVFFDLHLNKQLSKHSRRWWFEAPSRSLWRHFNGHEIKLHSPWPRPLTHFIGHG